MRFDCIGEEDFRDAIEVGYSIAADDWVGGLGLPTENTEWEKELPDFSEDRCRDIRVTEVEPKVSKGTKRHSHGCSFIRFVAFVEWMGFEEGGCSTRSGRRNCDSVDFQALVGLPLRTVGEDNAVARLQALDNFDRADGASAQLHLGSSGVHAVRIQLEHSDRALRLSERGAADIKNVVQSIEFDCAIDR